MWLDLRKSTFYAQLWIRNLDYKFFEVLHLGKDNRSLPAGEMIGTDNQPVHDPRYDHPNKTPELGTYTLPS